MSWKAYEYDDRRMIGTYPDEMAMAQALRKGYAQGARFIVENDDGREFEAFMDTTVRIVSGPPLALLENEDMYADENYSPRDS